MRLTTKKGMIVALGLLACSSAFGMSEAIDVNRFADAIYQAEGGNATRFPYGVKSINTHGDKAIARNITINSIRNNIKRWNKAGKPKPFVDFMADRWCPVSADRQGHTNWIANVSRLYEKGL